MAARHLIDSIPHFVHAVRVATNQSGPEPSAGRMEREYAFVYSEAARMLSDQKKDLTDLRNRTGVILSATAVTSAFFGDDALAQGALLVWEWVAVSCVVLVTVLVTMILVPRKGWRFDLSASVLLSGYVEAEEPVSLSGIHRRLADILERNWRHNEASLIRMHRYFTWASVLLSVEVLSWLAARIQEGR